MTELAQSLAGMTREQFQEHLDTRSVNTHDATAAASWFSEDGLQRFVATGPEGHGRDGVRDNMAPWFEALSFLYSDLIVAEEPRHREGRRHPQAARVLIEECPGSSA